VAADSSSPITLTAESAGSGEAGPLRLLVVDGPDRGAHLDLAPGVYRIGKGTEAQLTLTDPLVSREHLLVHVSARGVQLRDLGSKNGSFLGGTRLTQATLAPGTIVQLGTTKLRLVSVHAPPPPRASEATRFGALHGGSLAMRQVFAQLEAVAASRVHVLIEAETGCGKELTARALHTEGARASGPYVVCDLGATMGSLVESTLFGHVRGAITGATGDRPGAFVEADGGTIFLDEIGELPRDLQPRLLRVVETGQVKPVGADKYRDVDVRIVAATNRNLEEEVRAGRFREDLFYRLAVVRVRLPPLRERKEDIPHLVRLFLHGRGIELPPETLAVLGEYDWPGNVRELQNAMQRGLARRPGGGRLTPDLLGLDNSVGAALPWPGAGDKRSVLEIRDQLIAAWERAYLAQLLERCGGNVSRAAREGGLERAYLHRLLKRHNVR
jgi:DNA-binding NtrC family response regulator